MRSQAASDSALRVRRGGLRPALLGVIALASTISAFADMPVEIPDAVLRQCVEEALAKDRDAEITQGDMEDLTALVECDGVFDLDGLQYATNLGFLSSWHGGVADLSPLSGLARLQTLQLSRHRVGDLTPLAGLQSLQTLVLTNTYTADLSPVTTLPSLLHLDVSDGARIRELPLWPPSAPLRSLLIGGTGVRDLSPLATLTQLDTLGLGDLDLLTLDLTVLTHLTSLETLFLQSSNVDLNALSGLRNLTALYLNNASIADGLSSLANHTSLRVLSLSGTGLRSLDAIPSSVLESLQDVSLSRNLLSEITPLLSNGGELRRVDLRHNSWLSRDAVESDIPALTATGVEVLHDAPKGQRPNTEIIGDPALREALLRHFVSPFASTSQYVYEASMPVDRLASVLTLNLSNKGIASLQGMERAEDLKFLWLSGNDISDISPLADLPLWILALDGNALPAILQR